MSDYTWDGDNAIIVDGVRFEVVKHGVDYARQFGRLTSWIGTNGLQALMAARGSGLLDDVNEEQVAVKLFSYILGEGLSPESLVDLSSILLGCEYDFAEKHFDPGWFVELVVVVIQQPGYRKAFTKIWDQFFLATRTPAVDKGSKAQDS